MNARVLIDPTTFAREAAGVTHPARRSLRCWQMIAIELGRRLRHANWFAQHSDEATAGAHLAIAPIAIRTVSGAPATLAICAGESMDVAAQRAG